MEAKFKCNRCDWHIVAIYSSMAGFCLQIITSLNAVLEHMVTNHGES